MCEVTSQFLRFMSKPLNVHPDELFPMVDTLCLLLGYSADTLGRLISVGKTHLCMLVLVKVN